MIKAGEGRVLFIKSKLNMDTIPNKPPHCVYCGDWFQCRDHVIPVSWMQVYRDYKPGQTVHCCNLCNTLAGSFVAFSVIQKANYFATKYRKKFRKTLRLPDWTDKELEALEYGLRGFVRQQINERLLLEAKLENLDRVALGFEPRILNEIGFK